MADDVTLRECQNCHGRHINLLHREYKPHMHPGSRYAFQCEDCGEVGPWCRTLRQTIEVWNSYVPDPALTAAQARVAKLELQAVYLNSCIYRRDMRIAELEAEVERLRAAAAHCADGGIL